MLPESTQRRSNGPALSCGLVILVLQILIPLQSACAQSPWVSASKSTGQHPIEVARFGNGSNYVLIVGSMLGNEPESLELMDAACQLARQVSPPEPITVLLVRTPNPDGAAEHVHTNAHGVELNRNFPSRLFTSIPTRLTGPSPASEVETQYMLRILKEYKPSRVIHLRSGTGEQPLVYVNDRWGTGGQSAVLPKDVRQGSFQNSFKAGSLEEYADREMNSAVSTVFLPQKKYRQLQAAELLRFATSNVHSGTAPQNLAEEKPTPPQTSFSPPAAIPAEVESPDEEVEFLPPPPEFLTTGNPNRNADRDDSRYYELPPPPQ